MPEQENARLVTATTYDDRDEGPLQRFPTAGRGDGVTGEPRSAANPPRVSVVMPLFNGAAFVVSAVESILQQTIADLELIVVDDGSSDGSPDLVAAIEDPRIRLIRMPQNAGISHALNTGVAAARSEYVARMDADDESLSDRLAHQLAFLDEHPEVGVVGVNPVLIEQDGSRPRQYPLLTRDADLRRLLTLQGPFCHGSVVFRRTVFDKAGGYCTEDEPAEDYALWLRMAAVTHLANLPQYLYRLRVGDHSVSARNATRQLRRRDQIRETARMSLGDPDLRWHALREGLSYYRGCPEPTGRRLAELFVVQHQELACLDLARRGSPAWRNLMVSATLVRPGPRTLLRMIRYYRNAQPAARTDIVTSAPTRREMHP